MSSLHLALPNTKLSDTASDKKVTDLVLHKRDEYDYMSTLELHDRTYHFLNAEYKCLSAYYDHSWHIQLLP